MAGTDETYETRDPQENARLSEFQDGWTREQGRFLFSASRGPEPMVTRFAHRCTGERGAATERWLQSVLEKEAAILRDVIAPVSRDHREDEPWYCLGREKGVPNIGAIDVLYVTGSGRPIIVETKLIRNPENGLICEFTERGSSLRIPHPEREPRSKEPSGRAADAAPAAHAPDAVSMRARRYAVLLDALGPLVVSRILSTTRSRSS